MARTAYRWGVVGGGRWARVLAGSALRLLSPERGIVIVSRHSRDALEQWTAQLPSPMAGRVTISSDLDEVLSDKAVEAILIANRPVLHGQTARRALAADKHVFVEKPFVLDIAEAEALIADATLRDKVLAVGLEYLFASYLHHLRALIGSHEIESMTIDWSDPAIEYRHGDMKRIDTDISSIQDIVPHIWSIVRVVMAPKTMRARTASLRDSGANVLVDCDGAVISARIERDATFRVRRVGVILRGGRTVELDFSVEPGQPRLDGRNVPGCSRWGREPGPVLSELGAFRSAIDSGLAAPNVADACIGSVCLAAMAEQLAACSSSSVSGRFAP